MIDFICSSFAHCKNEGCLDKTSESIFYVKDTDDGRSCICTDSALEHPYLTINNPNGKEVNFLAIDCCIYNAQDPKRCDCAVFDDVKICFAELKRALGRRCKKSQKKREAIEQLKTTITDFKTKTGFPPHLTEAYICVGFNKPYPRTSAASLNNVLEFRQTLTTELFEGNQISF